MESRQVGSQIFYRSDRNGWQEIRRTYSAPRIPAPLSDVFLSFLYEDGIELVSTTGVTEGGVRVYEIALSEISKLPSNNAGGTKDAMRIRTTTVLIDQETFRFVSRIYYTRWDYSAAPQYGRSDNVDWAELIHTEHFFDYNEPVVIEVPDEYLPWSDDAVLSSVLGD